MNDVLLTVRHLHHSDGSNDMPRGVSQNLQCRETGAPIGRGGSGGPNCPLCVDDRERRLARGRRALGAG